MAKQQLLARDDSGRMARTHAQISTMPSDVSVYRGSWGNLLRFLSPST